MQHVAGHGDGIEGGGEEGEGGGSRPSRAQLQRDEVSLGMVILKGPGFLGIPKVDGRYTLHFLVARGDSLTASTKT